MDLFPKKIKKKMNFIEVTKEALAAAMKAAELSQEIQKLKREHNIKEIEIQDMFEITMENTYRVKLVFDICKTDLK